MIVLDLHTYSLERLAKASQSVITEAKKRCTVRCTQTATMSDMSDFVLFYAFYKEIAHFYHFTIPTYKEMLTDVTEARASSFLYFAEVEKAPIASLWVTKRDEQMLTRALGSVREGYALNADVLLLHHAIEAARQQDCREFHFLPEVDAYPHDRTRWEELCQLLTSQNN